MHLLNHNEAVNGANAMIAFLISKGLLCATYILWVLFWSGNTCAISFRGVVVIIFAVLSSIGVGAIMAALQPRCVSAKLLRNYHIICGWSLLSYFCLCITQAFYVGANNMLRCNNESYPQVLYMLFLIFGIAAMLYELYYGFYYCKELYYNDVYIYISKYN